MAMVWNPGTSLRNWLRSHTWNQLQSPHCSEKLMYLHLGHSRQARRDDVCNETS